LLFAQAIEIYPDLRRIDPFGATIPQDRGIVSREVLSPAVVRNAYTSFQIAVRVPPKESYFLYVVTNPLDACRVELYKEHFVRTARGWMPDTLAEVHRLPDFGVMPDPDDSVDGQNTRLYLLDLWIPPNANVARFRVEVQLKVADWTVRPMEVRVMPAVVPDVAAGRSPAIPLEAAASLASWQALSSYGGGVMPRRPERIETLRDILRRNAAQDIALAASLRDESTSPRALLRKALGLFEANTRFTPGLWGAEWWLRMRDALYALRPVR
jgi:hypothetical protein